MDNLFSLYLRECRKKMQMSQSQLALALPSDTSSLKGIDNVTISRWERGKTVPNYKSKAAIIRFFDKYDLDIYSYLDTKKTDSIIFEKMIHEVQKFFPNRFDCQILNFPDKAIGIHGYTVSKLSSYRQDHDFFDRIIDFDHSIYPTTAPVSPQTLSRWASNKSNICIVCERGAQYFGHFIGLLLRNDIFNKLIAAEMEENDIKDNHFNCENNSKSSLYIYSIYGINKNVAALLISYVFNTIIKKRKSIDFLGGLSVTNDGCKLSETFGLKPIKAGKLLNSGVNWLTYKRKLKDVIYGTKILKLIGI